MGAQLGGSLSQPGGKAGGNPHGHETWKGKILQNSGAFLKHITDLNAV